MMYFKRIIEFKLYKVMQCARLSSAIHLRTFCDLGKRLLEGFEWDQRVTLAARQLSRGFFSL